MSHPLLLTRGTVTLSVSGWAREVGLRPQTLHARLRRGWSLERAVATHTHSLSESGRLGARRSPWVAFGIFSSET
jgi:hypothetical protein